MLKQQVSAASRTSGAGAALLQRTNRRGKRLPERFHVHIQFYSAERTIDVLLLIVAAGFGLWQAEIGMSFYPV